MTYGHSVELRARAISFLDSGEKQQKVCEVFGISRRTLYAWIKLREATGVLEIKERPKIQSTRKLTPEDLLAHVEKHPDLNKVEPMWANIKQRLNSYYDNALSFHQNLDQKFNELCRC